MDTEVLVVCMHLKSMIKLLSVLNEGLLGQSCNHLIFILFYFAKIVILVQEFTYRVKFGLLMIFTKNLRDK